MCVRFDTCRNTLAASTEVALSVETMKCLELFWRGQLCNLNVFPLKEEASEERN